MSQEFLKNGIISQIVDKITQLQERLRSLEVGSKRAPLYAHNYTTAERNALSAERGMIVWNSTTSKLQVYDGASWIDLH